eukprot:401433_1
MPLTDYTATIFMGCIIWVVGTGVGIFMILQGTIWCTHSCPDHLTIDWGIGIIVLINGGPIFVCGCYFACYCMLDCIDNINIPKNKYKQNKQNNQLLSYQNNTNMYVVGVVALAVKEHE